MPPVAVRSRAHHGGPRLQLVHDNTGSTHILVNAGVAGVRVGLYRSEELSAFKAIRDLPAAQSESRAMRATHARLQAWNIVQADRQVFLVLPLHAGNARWLAQVLPVARAAAARDVLHQVTGDLARMHAAGYVHRDVKLENMLLSFDGSVLLADYGLTVPADTLGVMECAGTLSHFAPEVLRQGRVSMASDVWSLGVAYAGLLLGPTPFESTGDALQHNLRTYTQWHAALPRVDGNGNIDARGIAGGGAPWSNYFAPLAQADAQAAVLLLQHMLQPNPTLRLPAAALLERLPHTRTDLPWQTWAQQHPETHQARALLRAIAPMAERGCVPQSA